MVGFICRTLQGLLRISVTLGIAPGHIGVCGLRLPAPQPRIPHTLQHGCSWNSKPQSHSAGFGPGSKRIRLYLFMFLLRDLLLFLGDEHERGLTHALQITANKRPLPQLCRRGQGNHLYMSVQSLQTNWVLM